jgi:hypothetical protein
LAPPIARGQHHPADKRRQPGKVEAIVTMIKARNERKSIAAKI